MKLENIFGIPNFQLVTIRVGTVLYIVEEPSPLLTAFKFLKCLSFYNSLQLHNGLKF